MSGLVLAMLLAQLDNMIIAPALPTIVGELGGLNHLSWVVTAHIMASPVATPIWGKLGDIFGHKHTFTASIVLFLIGSALCGRARPPVAASRTTLADVVVAMLASSAATWDSWTCRRHATDSRFTARSPRRVRPPGRVVLGASIAGSGD
jgi:MFS family permease